MKQVTLKQIRLFTIVFIGGLSALSSILSTLRSELNLSPALALAFQYIWFLFMCITIGLLVITALNYRQTVKAKQVGIQRQRLIETVKAFWVTGVLEQSLHASVFIMPELHVQPSTIVPTARRKSTKGFSNNSLSRREVVRNMMLTNRSTRGTIDSAKVPNAKQQLFPETSVTQVYDDTAGKLLILGAPGVGKTTLLLELANDLLGRATRDPNYPIPVIFNLSHWAKKRQVFDIWLVEELCDRYQVPQYLAREWVSTQKVLPLLDNLDEVPKAYYSECVSCIIVYRGSIVVCCESNVHHSRGEPFRQFTVVTIQAFAPHQIDDYLTSVDVPEADLYSVIHNNPVVQKLATSPQALSMLVRSCHEELTLDSPSTNSLITPQRQLSAAYVQSMLQQQTKEAYQHQRTMQWLAWLAWLLAKRNRTSFSIADMNARWFSEPALSLLYSLIVLLLACVINGLLGVLIGWVVGEPNGVIISLLVGSWVLLRGDHNLRNRFIEPTALLEIGIWRNLGNALAGGLVVGMMAGIMGWLLFWHAAGLVIGLVGGLVLGLVSGLVGGVVGGLIVLLGALLFGEMTQELVPVKPYQGLWLYAYNSIVIGLFGGLVIVLLSFFFIALILALFYGLGGFLAESGSAFINIFIWLLLPSNVVLMSIWEIIVLFVGLSNGGNTFIRLLALRLFLRITKHAPWDYSRFLDYAVKCHLLRKVGKEYMFAYRPLLDYFATLDMKSNPHSSVRLSEDSPKAD